MCIHTHICIHIHAYICIYAHKRVCFMALLVFVYTYKHIYENESERVSLDLQWAEARVYLETSERLAYRQSPGEWQMGRGSHARGIENGAGMRGERRRKREYGLDHCPLYLLWRRGRVGRGVPCLLLLQGEGGKGREVRGGMVSDTNNPLFPSPPTMAPRLTEVLNRVPRKVERQTSLRPRDL